MACTVVRNFVTWSSVAKVMHKLWYDLAYFWFYYAFLFISFQLLMLSFANSFYSLFRLFSKTVISGTGKKKVNWISDDSISFCPWGTKCLPFRQSVQYASLHTQHIFFLFLDYVPTAILSSLHDLTLKFFYSSKITSRKEETFVIIRDLFSAADFPLILYLRSNHVLL